MTSLDKFQTLDINARESFLSALGMFHELDAAYRAKINALLAEVPSENAVVSAQPSAPMSEKAERLRERIARDIWEPTTRRELVDRLTDLVVKGAVSARELERAIKDATRRRSTYEKTGGRDGVETIWKALGYWAKCVYETHGMIWSPTSSELEPCPYKNQSAPTEEPEEKSKLLTYEETREALDKARRELAMRSCRVGRAKA